MSIRFAEMQEQIHRLGSVITRAASRTRSGAGRIFRLSR